jgi:O-methyltransferase
MIKEIAKGVNLLLGKALHKKNVMLTSTLEYLGRERKLDRNYFDYVRLATLELISYEINKNNYTGNVAELGVYKGKFARYINQFFPDRKFYLFDTFQGFDKKDVDVEKTHDYSSGKQDFSNTSVEAVLSIMPFPERCVPVKGFFPESAKDVDDEFVFVSLDADLYAPIYNGLKFFYPRLARGGYIFVHDFNNEGYKGARKAVEDFCRETGVAFIPIPDSAGSAIIAK